MQGSPSGQVAPIGAQDPPDSGHEPSCTQDSPALQLLFAVQRTICVVVSPKQVRNRSQGPKLPQSAFAAQVVRAPAWISGKYCSPTLIPADCGSLKNAPIALCTDAHLVVPAAVFSVIEPELSTIM